MEQVLAFAGLEVVDLMVPRDGVEPATPAFSGLDSAVVILLIPLQFTIFQALQTAFLLEHY
ncbi:MAG TPA: hypothetical protein VEH47_04090, partial [Candidatus Acidoferrales bacterium]|nr:hypothetical protein [Candidatus Acidoferrales bacterium]